MLYEYVATGLDHLQLYLPLTQQNSPIVFSITGTDSMFSAIAPISLLFSYVGLPLFGGFSTYTNEYNLIRNKVYELLGGLIANDATQNTREIVFTGHSMGAYTSFKLYKALHEGQTYRARLGGVKAFCPFVWNDDITHDMRELCETAQTRGEIEIFAIKDDYASALLKVQDHAFGTISWYDGDGSLDYTDVTAFSQITQAIYKANVNHTIDYFSPTDPVNVRSSVPKQDYGNSRSIKSVKQQDVPLIWGAGTATALTLFTPLAETASAYFNVPHSVGSLLADATSDTQFGFNVLYAQTYRNKYFYYDEGGQRYVSLLTNLVSHSNQQYIQYLYFERVSVTNGNQDYVIYTWNGANKSYYKLKQNGSFSALLGLPDYEDGGGTSHTVTRSEKAGSGVTQADRVTAEGLDQDNWLRFKFHIVPAIDSAYGPRRSVSDITVPHNLYNVVSPTLTDTANFTIKFVNTDNTQGSSGEIFHVTQTYTAQTRAVNFSPSFVQSAWTGWQIDPDFNPPDESVFSVQALSYYNNLVKISCTLPSASLGVFGQALETGNPLDDNTLTHPAHSFTWFQITDFTYVSATQFTCKLRSANKATNPYHKFLEPASSANDGVTGWYGELNWSNQADALTYIFDKLP
ncbi:hypothetical protein OAA16_00945 [Candidatus Pelagibacter sp.]|nr:hypothetical protein [Candidatus Pelagibacter sp.]